MTSPQNAIAATLVEHRPYGLDCKCGQPFNSDAAWAAHASERMAAALELTSEIGASASDPEPDGWMPDDEEGRLWAEKWANQYGGTTFRRIVGPWTKVNHV